MIGDQDVWAGLPETDPRTLLERVYKLQSDKLEAIFGPYGRAVLELIAEHEPKDDAGRSAILQAKRLLAEMRADTQTAT